MRLKVHVDGHLSHHVAGWRNFSPNQFDGVIFAPIFLACLVFENSRFCLKISCMKWFICGIFFIRFVVYYYYVDDQGYS